MAPTNVTRSAARPERREGRRKPPIVEERLVLIRAGKAAVRARLRATATAQRIWSALPLKATAETWGGAVHFEIPIESGRERGAKAVVVPGEIAYWSEEDRVLIAFGPTPISGGGEIRLPSPCNVWAVALDDVAAFSAVQPGTEVAMSRIEAAAPRR